MPKRKKKKVDPAKQARVEIYKALNERIANAKDTKLAKKLRKALKGKAYSLKSVLKELGFDYDELLGEVEARLLAKNSKVLSLLKKSRRQAKEGKVHDLEEVLKELKKKRRKK